MVTSAFAKASPLNMDHFIVAVAFKATAEAVWGSIALIGLQNEPVNSLTHKQSGWYGLSTKNKQRVVAFLCTPLLIPQHSCQGIRIFCPLHFNLLPFHTWVGNSLPQGHWRPDKSLSSVFFPFQRPIKTLQFPGPLYDQRSKKDNLQWGSWVPKRSRAAVD